MNTTPLSAADNELIEGFNILAAEAALLAEEAQAVSHEAAQVAAQTESATIDRPSPIPTSLHALTQADTEAIEALDQLILDQATLIAERFD